MILCVCQELHKRVLEEQEEFMKYLENVAQHSIDEYEFISPVASKFIEVLFVCQ